MQLIAASFLANMASSSGDNPPELFDLPHEKWITLKDDKAKINGEIVQVEGVWPDLNEVFVRYADGKTETVGGLKPTPQIKPAFFSLGSPILYHRNGIPPRNRELLDLVKFYVTETRIRKSDSVRICFLRKATLCNLRISSNQLLKVPENDLIQFQDENAFTDFGDESERVYPPCLMQIPGKCKPQVVPGVAQNMTHQKWLEYRPKSIDTSKRYRRTRSMHRLAESERK